MRAIFALTLLFSCLAEVLMGEVDAKVAQAVQSCMAENGITMKDVQEANSFSINPDDVKENLKCAILCFYVKLGVMDPNGQLHQDNMLALAPDDDIRATMEEGLAECAGTAGANPCDSAYRFLDCFGRHFDNLFGTLIDQ